MLTDEAQAERVIDDPENEPLVPEVWTSYRHTVEHNSSYYPSTLEVMAIATALNANVEIVELTQTEGLRVSYTSHRRLRGPCSMICIENSGQRFVRGHF